MQYLQKKEFASLRFTPGDEILTNNLRLGAQQLFVKRWMSSVEPHARLFVKQDTGSGKTIASLATAAEYIELYRELNSEASIYVIGFQKNTFQNEVLRRPSLGFITNFEYQHLKALEEKSKSNIEMHIEEYQNYMSWLKRKITTPRYGGVIKFIGYKELVNKMYVGGKLKKEYIQSFEKSFIIFDEIHNTYNSLNTNTYGDAINELLDNVEVCKVLFMSATPINNKPSEIVDIINMVVPSEKRGGHKFVKEDFFKEEKLKPGALGRIETLVKGYFSFYSSKDKTFLPTYELIGKHLEYKNKKIEMLKFIECPMSKKHLKVYNENVEDTLPADSYMLLDMVFPGGIYKNVDIESINTKVAKYNGEVVTGAFLEANNLKEYSTKYYKMIQDLIIINKNNDGKIIITHEYVRGSGIKLISEILKLNGFLPETGAPTPNTFCSICGVIQSKHDDEHLYKPARFGLMYGELSKNTINKTLGKFNADSNNWGHDLKIIVGSESIREGIDFKAVRHMLIMHPVPNISSLIQTLGRPVRKKSHISLPRDKWHVKIGIYISTGGSNYSLKKYYTKIKEYKVIQEIEKVINKTAVDAPIYYNIIKDTFVKNELGNLEYKISRPKFAKIDDDKFSVFYRDWEVQEIKNIILSLFMRVQAWRLEDLWELVKDPPFTMHVDPSMFEKDNFLLALGDIVYGSDDIINKEGHKYKVVFKGGFYILFPMFKKEENESKLGVNISYLHGEPNISYMSWLIPEEEQKKYKVNIMNVMLNMNKSYDVMKEKFYKQFINTEFKDMPKTTEIYDTDFHIKLIEECIMYVFNIYTSEKKKLSEYHYFYFKMLHYYFQLDLIIFASTLPKEILGSYKDYISGTTDRNNFLMTSLKSSSITSIEIREIDNFIKKNPKKVPAHILPVGHYLTTNYSGISKPRLFYPIGGWKEVPELGKLLSDPSIKENDIIVGYYAHVPNSINFKFKIRTPKHLIDKKDDTRMVERGIVCETKRKKYLIELAKKLNIQPIGSSIDICEAIKIDLIQRELKDRNQYRKGRVKKRTRWFYYHFEHNF